MDYLADALERELFVDARLEWTEHRELPDGAAPELPAPAKPPIEVRAA